MCNAPKRRPKRLVLIEVQVLIAEEQHLVGEQRRLDLCESGVVDTGQFDPLDFRADYRRQWLNVHGTIIGTS